jgi:hypothetical protein
MGEYLVSSSRRTWDTKYIGRYWVPSSRTRAALTTCSVTAKYKSKESPAVGLIRHEGFAKYCFTFSKGSTHSSVHSKCAALCIVLKNRRQTSPNLAINQLRAANFPVSD